MATPAREEGGCLPDTSSAKQDEVDGRRVRRSVATELPEDLAFLRQRRSGLVIILVQNYLIVPGQNGAGEYAPERPLKGVGLLHWLI